MSLTRAQLAALYLQEARLWFLQAESTPGDTHAEEAMWRYLLFWAMYADDP